MDAVNHIARMLKIKSSNFGFAGTKDRRAATTQRVSVWRQATDNLNWLNSKAPNIKVGDFSYHKAPIQLGQHGGNEFTIVIKNVGLMRGVGCSMEHRLRMAEQCVQMALDSVLENGFINYFGLQRFGTHAVGTQEVGMKILSGDFEGAINCILHVEPAILANTVSERELETMFHKDEICRGRAIAVWKATGNLQAALNSLPKRYNAETTILRHLGRSPESRRDHCGALLQITRGLRNLYIHAYQSYVWNWVASARWAKYGSRVIKGDLILVESECNPARFREAKDMSEDVNQEEEIFYQEARQLTAAEAASGQYSIFDIVLPVPGYDCLYPANEIGDVYVDFMKRPENGRMDPYNMLRRQKEFSLSGHYRKLVARFSTTPKFFVLPYVEDAEQMQPTDLDEIRVRKEEELRLREERRAACSWQQLAQGVQGRDNEELEARRRQRSVDPPETRINDAWIERAPEGGSKRMKVEQVFASFGATDPIEGFAGPHDANAFPKMSPGNDDISGGSTVTIMPADSASNLGIVPTGQLLPVGLPTSDDPSAPLSRLQNVLSATDAGRLHVQSPHAASERPLHLQPNRACCRRKENPDWRFCP